MAAVRCQKEKAGQLTSKKEKRAAEREACHNMKSLSRTSPEVRTKRSSGRQSRNWLLRSITSGDMSLHYENVFTYRNEFQRATLIQYTYTHKEYAVFILFQWDDAYIICVFNNVGFPICISTTSQTA